MAEFGGNRIDRVLVDVEVDATVGGELRERLLPSALPPSRHVVSGNNLTKSQQRYGTEMVVSWADSVLSRLDLSAYAANIQIANVYRRFRSSFDRSARAKGHEIMVLVRIDLRKGKDPT